MALNWYKRDMVTPGFPVVTLTEIQWRARVAQYVRDAEGMEKVMVADQHWLVFPNEHLWMSTTGTFNPTTSTASPSANLKPSHRPGDTIN